jgi:hypothetical protein
MVGLHRPSILFGLPRHRRRHRGAKPAGGASTLGEEAAQGHAKGGGVTLQEVEARLRSEPELDELAPGVVVALARAVMRFVQARVVN